VKLREFKKKALLLAVIGAGFMVTAIPATAAKEIVFTGQTIEVRLKIGTVTELTFPAPVVPITKTEPSILQITAADERIYLLPGQNRPLSLYFIGRDKTAYPIKTIIDEENWDERIKIIKLAQNSQKSRGKNTTINLMRDLLLGIDSPGATKTKGNAEVYNDGSIRLKMKILYDLPQARGYVLVAENLLNKIAVIPIQEIDIPGLRAISAEQQTLAPKGREGSHTNVYMVVGR